MSDACPATEVERVIVRMPLSDAAVCTDKLVEAECMVAVDGEYLWISVVASELNDGALKSVPGVRFNHHSGRLVRIGRQVPEATLPELQWQAPTELLKLALPVAAMAAARVAWRAPELKLVRSSGDAKPVAGLYSLADMARWADEISSLRLSPLRYAIASGGCGGEQAIVTGQPLPSLACTFLWQSGRVLLPLGFRWTPNVAASVVESLFAVPDGNSLLWLSDDNWSYLPQDVLRPLTRASIRVSGQLKK